MGKRLLLTTLIVALCFVMAIPAYAAEDVNSTSETIYYDDGSYAVITTSVEAPKIVIMATASTKTGSRTFSYYDSNSRLQWTFTVKGTFSYDGKSARATSVSTSYNISGTGWSYVSATKSTSGATAKGTGTFSKGGSKVTQTVSLTCSKTGVIS